MIGAEQLALLREFIPSLLWENRDQFFFEGMRLEVGECFADYSPPAFYQAATEKFRGQPKLLPNSGLDGYTAGQPFPADTISPDDVQAGAKWAWNYEQRYQAAGLNADFRISDIVGQYGRAEPFLGHIYKAQIAHRADRSGHNYRAKGSKKLLWVAGGEMSEPFNARGHAWRQFRDMSSETSPRRTDDLHAYLASARRVRRLTAAYVEGLYLPSFSVAKSFFLAKLTYPTAFVLDRENIEANPKNWFRKPNGTGPFRMTEYKVGETLILSRNEGYHLGPPKLGEEM